VENFKNFMKSILFSVLLLSPFFSFSQYEPKPEISLMAGYMWGGSTLTVNGELKIEDGTNYGVILDLPIAKKGITLELLYSRLDSKLNFKSRTGGTRDSSLFDMSTNYIQIGGLKEVETGTNLRPFGIFALGTTIFGPKNSSFADQWVLSFSLGGGLKYYLSERIGLRLDARFLFPVYLTGGGFYCGTGGCGAGIGSSPAILQGYIDGGVIIRLGQ
jgi:hypothetical protein